MKTGSVNTEFLKRTIEESPVKEVDSKKSKTEELPSKVEILMKIINLIVQGREGDQLKSELAKLFPLSTPAELTNLTAEVVAKYPADTLTKLNPNAIEKIAKEIANPETKQVNTGGHQNPESAQVSPIQGSPQASPGKEAPITPNGVKNHTDRLEKAREATLVTEGNKGQIR